MPPKQDVSLWNLIYCMLQFLMEQNKAIYHDCCFEHKVREEVVQTTSKLNDGSSPPLPRLLADIHLGSSGQSQPDHLNHWPPCVASEQAEKLFLKYWENKWFPCILCGKFGSLLCRYEKFMRLKWFIHSSKNTGIGVTENLFITHITHRKVSGQ